RELNQYHFKQPIQQRLSAAISGLGYGKQERQYRYAVGQLRQRDAHAVGQGIGERIRRAALKHDVRTHKISALLERSEFPFVGARRANGIFQFSIRHRSNLWINFYTSNYSIKSKNKEKNMNDEVYSTPQSNLDMEKNIDVPEEVLKKIRNAWVAGLISIVVTFVFTLISILGTDILGLDAFAFVDVFLMAIFTFGIYKKSRTCAVLMLLLFAANKVIMWFE